MNDVTSSSGSLALLDRHDDLWLSDGSVVLVAEDTLFKVHKSQLSRHSVVFRDMFAMPQLEGAGRMETLDGCDVVRLHDSAQDIESLLRALYDGPTFGDNSAEDFAIVSGVLRLSNKYLIEPLRTRAIAHLSLAWPSTLSAWDAREDVAERRDRRDNVPRSEDLQEFDFLRKTSDYYPHAARVLTLAREVHAPSLLPAAFYELARHSFASLLSNDPRCASPDLPGTPPEIDPTYDALGLAPPDFRRLALGKEAGALHIIQLIRSMAAIRSGSAHHHAHSHAQSSRVAFCATPAACRKDFHELAELATQHYVFDRHHGSADPLYVAEELGSLKSAELAAQTECRACAFALESWSQREREKIWKLIPSWFRLDSWESMAES